MVKGKERWARIKSEYEDNDLCRIDAWKTDDENEEGKTVAMVDMLTGRVIYLEPLARTDPDVQERIRILTAEAKRNHPYSLERLESILKSVVDYECGEGSENGRFNLASMGFEEEEMVFFGFPPYIHED